MLARRMLGQEIVMSPSRCFKFDTYYLAEEGTVCIVQGARKLTPEQKKLVDEHENVFNVPDLLPAMEVLRAQGEFEFLVVPAYTVHQIMMQTDALMTVGHIVPKGKNGEDGQDYTTLKDHKAGLWKEGEFSGMLNDKAHYTHVHWN